MMSPSNQRPANRGFRSVLRCAISHYRQVPSLSAPEPVRGRRPAGPACPSLRDSRVRLGKHPLHRESGCQQTEKETPCRRKVCVKNAGAKGCGKCRPRGNPLQSQRVSTAAWKTSASTLPQPRRRIYLRTINQGVGPFYSVGVGSFYVVKASTVASVNAP